MERAGAQATECAAKKEKLQKALDAKDRLLKEEASENAGLTADLEQAPAKAMRLREEVKEEVM